MEGWEGRGVEGWEEWGVEAWEVLGAGLEMAEVLEVDLGGYLEAGLEGVAEDELEGEMGEVLEERVQLRGCLVAGVEVSGGVEEWEGLEVPLHLQNVVQQPEKPYVCVFS